MLGRTANFTTLVCRLVGYDYELPPRKGFISARGECTDAANDRSWYTDTSLTLDALS